MIRVLLLHLEILLILLHMFGLFSKVIIRMTKLIHVRFIIPIDILILRHLIVIVILKIRIIIYIVKIIITEVIIIWIIQ